MTQDTQVERTWRPKDEDPQQGDSQDSDPQDDSSQGGQGDSQQDGSEQDGSEQGNPDQGDSQQGDSQQGDSQQGNNQPGSGQASNGQPSNGEAGGGQPGEGDNQPGNQQPGNGQPGNQQPGNQQPGTPQGGAQGQPNMQGAPQPQASGAEFPDGTSDPTTDLNDSLSASENNWKASAPKTVKAVSKKKPKKKESEERHRGNSAAQIEEAIDEFMEKVQGGRSSGATNKITTFVPGELEDRQIANEFAIMVSKLAEERSAETTYGNDSWDVKKLMKRRFDHRHIYSCKHSFEKERLALLVDTSPSCTSEAVFYSKIACGAMLRDDIDIFIAPNGYITARYDRDLGYFVTDRRDDEWGLDGRIVFYFCDWDPFNEILKNSEVCTIYWFDKEPGRTWEEVADSISKNGYYMFRFDDIQRKVQENFHGVRYWCPDKSAFRKLSRKVRS